MAARRCPKCKLINPGTASACDCGWSFVEGRLTAPRPQPGRDDRALRRDRRTRGIVQLVVGGLLITAVGETARSREAVPEWMAHDRAYIIGTSVGVLIFLIPAVLLIAYGIINLRK